MSLFEWDESFSVRLFSVDHQHRRLVAMINLLDETVAVGGDETLLRHILKELCAYTEYHFATEEEMMRVAGPRLRNHYLRHKAEHDEFTARIRPLGGDAVDVSGVDDALLDYLVRWLIDHILGSDKEMARLMAEASGWAEGLESSAVTAPAGGVIDDAHRRTVERNLLGALKESETRFHNLSDSIPVLIWVSDAQGHRISFNQPWQTFSGQSLSALKGGGWRDAVHPDDLAGYDEAIAGGTAHKQRVSHELRLRQADGRYRWFLESTVPRLTPQGRFLGLIGSALDITERKQAEELLVHARERLEQEVARQTAELRDTNRRLEKEKAEQRALIRKLQETRDQLLQSEKMASIGQLAAGVAHEINNPVGYIGSNLHSLESYSDDLFRVIDAYAELESSLDEPQRSTLERLKEDVDFSFLREDLKQLIIESREGTDRVKKIVQDLKDFSHVDEAEWQWADLHKGLDSTLNVVHNEIKYKADIVREYGELPLVHCLPAQINQVFMNILVNAAQSIRERGTITLRSGRRSDYAWFEITDSGVGIPADKVKRIFEPFFTTKPVGKGTGLGLSLTYSIVDKHEGHIEVESEPGQGTTMRIWLPINGPAEQASLQARQDVAPTGRVSVSR